MPNANFIENLQQAVSTADKPHQIPPLENWHPKPCGEMDMVIKANGDWYHEGQKVTRQSLVDLFAKVLWAEIDESNQVNYFLKTPFEKLRINVEDAPLLITQVDSIEQDGTTWLQFTTSQGDKVRLDAQHPLRFGLPFANVKADSQQQPYLLVRQNGDSQLYGLIHRNVFYHLIEMGELLTQQDLTILRLSSGNHVFELSMPTDNSSEP